MWQVAFLLVDTLVVGDVPGALSLCAGTPYPHPDPISSHVLDTSSGRPAAGVAITLTSGQCWGLFYAVNFQIFHTGSSNKVTLGAPSLCRQAEPQ